LTPSTPIGARNEALINEHAITRPVNALPDEFAAGCPEAALAGRSTAPAISPA
jgi:hypothetical protein